MSNDLAMKRGRCPRCGKEFQYTSVSSHKSFPFCSARCRDVDLGKWLMGGYVIPGVEGSVNVGEDEEMSPERDAT